MDRRHDEVAVAGSLAVVGAFQVALALGAPWGRAAYGGTHAGPLPARLRATSAVAAVAYGTSASLVLRGTGSPTARHRGFTALAAVMAVGSLANAASRSPVERVVWTPVTLATGLLAWRSRSTGV